MLRTYPLFLCIKLNKYFKQLNNQFYNQFIWFHRNASNPRHGKYTMSEEQMQDYMNMIKTIKNRI